MANKSKAKEGFTIKIEYTPHLPNEAHRAAKWEGGKVQRNRKKYTRKGKLKGLPLERTA
jgi:hypothetical protein